MLYFSEITTEIKIRYEGMSTEFETVSNKLLIYKYLFIMKPKKNQCWYSFEYLHV